MLELRRLRWFLLWATLAVGSCAPQPSYVVYLGSPKDILSDSLRAFTGRVIAACDSGELDTATYLPDVVVEIMPDRGPIMGKLQKTLETRIRQELWRRRRPAQLEADTDKCKSRIAVRVFDYDREEQACLFLFAVFQIREDHDQPYRRYKRISPVQQQIAVPLSDPNIPSKTQGGSLEAYQSAECRYGEIMAAIDSLKPWSSWGALEQPTDPPDMEHRNTAWLNVLYNQTADSLHVKRLVSEQFGSTTEFEAHLYWETVQLFPDTSRIWLTSFYRDLARGEIVVSLSTPDRKMLEIDCFLRRRDDKDTPFEKMETPEPRRVALQDTTGFTYPDVALIDRIRRKMMWEVEQAGSQDSGHAEGSVDIRYLLWEFPVEIDPQLTFQERPENCDEDLRKERWLEADSQTKRAVEVGIWSEESRWRDAHHLRTALQKWEDYLACYGTQEADSLDAAQAYIVLGTILGDPDFELDDPELATAYFREAASCCSVFAPMALRLLGDYAVEWYNERRDRDGQKYLVRAAEAYGLALTRCKPADSEWHRSLRGLRKLFSKAGWTRRANYIGEQLGAPADLSEDTDVESDSLAFYEIAHVGMEDVLRTKLAYAVHDSLRNYLGETERFIVSTADMSGPRALSSWPARPSTEWSVLMEWERTDRCLVTFGRVRRDSSVYGLVRTTISVGEDPSHLVEIGRQARRFTLRCLAHARPDLPEWLR